MNFKNASSLIAISFLVTGCQTTAPKATLATSSVNTPSEQTTKLGCGYDENNQPEYELTDLAKQYVTNSIKSTPNGNYDPQYNNKKYFDPVVNNTFKFSVETQKNKFYERFQKDDIFELNGKPYIYSGYEMVKIITSSCQVFWYERGNYASQTMRNIQRADGNKFGLTDYQFILGDKNINEFQPPKAKIVHDKFKNSIKITGLYDNNMMFRDWGSTKTGKLDDDYVQLYADVKFLGEWAHLDHAYDEDANRRKLVKIDTDIDCSSDVLGCQLTETIGIELPISYLETKPNGFEVKVSGKQERVLKISSYQTAQILDAINTYK